MDFFQTLVFFIKYKASLRISVRQLRDKGGFIYISSFVYVLHNVLTFVIFY
jgi:hypothetical protein